jgi:hypothetical protein
VANQNKKNNRRQERTTCSPNGNPGPVNKIRTVQAHRIINAKALRVLSFITGFTGGLCEEGSSELFLLAESFIGLFGEQTMHLVNS